MDNLANYYIFTASDTELISGGNRPANRICRDRLKELRWPLYKRTFFRKHLKSNDICLFYIAGNKDFKHHIIAKAIVKNLTDSRGELVDDENLLSGIPYSEVFFKDVTYLDKPFNIKENLDLLSFIPSNKNKWGTAFQGGVKKISYADYQVIIGNNL